jgi:hypothetical protein
VGSGLTGIDPSSPHLIRHARSPIDGPKGDEQASIRTRPDAARHPRPRKPSLDLGRVCVVSDAAAIRICGASPRLTANFFRLNPSERAGVGWVATFKMPLLFFLEKGVDISSDKLQRGPHKKTKLQTSPTVKRPRRRHPSAVGGAPLLLLP